jgi:hypothetical protein
MATYDGKDSQHCKIRLIKIPALNKKGFVFVKPKTNMITFDMFDGNDNVYTRSLPKITILCDIINDEALTHIQKQTGLKFKKDLWYGYSAQPTSFDQYLKLLLTHNYKTRYYNNWTYKNTLFLKSDHHIGFQVESICYACVKYNRIVSNGLKPGERLAC